MCVCVCVFDVCNMFVLYNTSRVHKESGGLLMSKKGMANDVPSETKSERNERSSDKLLSEHNRVHGVHKIKHTYQVGRQHIWNHTISTLLQLSDILVRNFKTGLLSAQY